MLWLPTFTVTFLLIGICIAIFSGFQAAPIKQKIVKSLMGAICLYLLLPLILNSADWAVTGPPTPPTIENFSQLETTSGVRYAELALNPDIPAEVFQERLAPFLDAARIGIPYERSEILTARNLTQNKPRDVQKWELQPPIGHTQTQVDNLIQNLIYLKPQDQTETLVFLLKLGNQLTQLPFIDTYTLGKTILQKSLAKVARLPQTLQDKRIKRELADMKNLPARKLEAKLRDLQTKQALILCSVWSPTQKPTLHSLLVNRKLLELGKQGYTTDTADTKNENQTKLTQKILLQGQIYHLFLLENFKPKKGSPNADALNAPNAPTPEIEGSITKLARILLNQP